VKIVFKKKRERNRSGAREDWREGNKEEVGEKKKTLKPVNAKGGGGPSTRTETKNISLSMKGQGQGGDVFGNVSMTIRGNGCDGGANESALRQTQRWKKQIQSATGLEKERR